MNEINDFSKQWFAAFIAARLRAHRMERDESRPVGRNSGRASSPNGREESRISPSQAAGGFKDLPLDQHPPDRS
jgi:hypothetical protein